MSAASFLPHAFSVLCEAYAERSAQITREGFDLLHDDLHKGGELACAAASYALSAADTTPMARAVNANKPPETWPWHHTWWKPKTPRRDAIKAIALLIAEVERIDRATSPHSVTPRDALSALDAIMPPRLSGTQESAPLLLDAYDAHKARELEAARPKRIAYLHAISGQRITRHEMEQCAFGYHIDGVELPPLTRSMFTRAGDVWLTRFLLDADICIALQERERAARGATP